MNDGRRGVGSGSVVTGGTLRQRLLARFLGLASSVLRRLPHTLLHRIAALVGAGLYLAQPRRRALVRANLGRVCSYLDARDMGSPAARAAARDRRALDRLVRSAFGHYVRSYLEVALAPGYTAATVEDRLVVEDPEMFDAVLDGVSQPGARGLILVALHFGSIELAGMWLNARTKLPLTVPMETIANEPLQEFLRRSRSATGVRLVPSERVARELRATIGRAEAVALVADRPLDKPGHAVPFFGVPAPLPVGPAMLAIESGAAVIVGAARRVGWDRYAGRVVPMPVPQAGTRRERIDAFMTEQVRLFEQLIADAPEQWWTLFFPIWPDLPGDGAVPREVAR